MDLFKEGKIVGRFLLAELLRTASRVGSFFNTYTIMRILLPLEVS